MRVLIRVSRVLISSGDGAIATALSTVIVLSAHQWEVRDETAYVHARRRDNSDRHQRTTPRFIWFVHEHVTHAGLGEHTRGRGKLVARRSERDRDRRRRCGVRIRELRRLSSGMDRLRELDTCWSVAAHDHVVGGPTAAAVNAWLYPKARCAIAQARSRPGRHAACESPFTRARIPADSRSDPRIS